MEHVLGSEKAYALQRAQIDSAIQQLADDTESVLMEVEKVRKGSSCATVSLQEQFKVTQVAHEQLISKCNWEKTFLQNMLLSALDLLMSHKQSMQDDIIGDPALSSFAVYMTCCRESEVNNQKPCRIHIL